MILFLLRVTGSTHHFSPSLVGNPHLLQHLVALLHEEGALVGVVRDVRVRHLHDLDVGFNPKVGQREKKDLKILRVEIESFGPSFFRFSLQKSLLSGALWPERSWQDLSCISRS